MAGGKEEIVCRVVRYLKGATFKAAFVERSEASATGEDVDEFVMTPVGRDTLPPAIGEVPLCGADPVTISRNYDGVCGVTMTPDCRVCTVHHGPQ